MKVAITILVIIGIIAAIVTAIIMPDMPTGRVSQGDEGDIRILVEGFGKKLQNVSLLDQRDAAEAIEKNYAPYLAPALLLEWKEDPTKALGRSTSSPWPDRIEIDTIEKKDDGYTVRGNVVEVTNEGGGIAEQPAVAARRSIVLGVEKIGGEWRITKVTVGTYAGEGNWVLSPQTAQNIQFMYPNPLQTTFISAQTWPPIVEMLVGNFTCTEEPTTAADGSLKTGQRHTVEDRVYCVTISSEGAAGSTYRTYEYTTAQGNAVVRVVFILRFPQCANYDEPNRSACALEQETFDLDGLVDRIVSSVRKL